MKKPALCGLLPGRDMPSAARCGFRSRLPLGLLRAAAAVQFQDKCFGDTALATRLAFGDGEGLGQFDDPLLLCALVFPMLLARFRQFAAGGF